MLRRVVLLGPEDRAYLKDPLEAGGHHHLLVELGALVQEGLLLEVRHREEVGPPLGRSGHELRGGDIHEPPGGEKVPDPANHGGPDEKDRRDPGPAKVEEPGVEPGVELGGHLFHHVEGERGRGRRENLEPVRDDLPSAGRLLDGLHRPLHPHHRFPGEAPEGLEDGGRGLLPVHGDLHDAGPVPDQAEGETAQVPLLVDPAGDLRPSA